jgi:hypothetical protein
VPILLEHWCTASDLWTIRLATHDCLFVLGLLIYRPRERRRQRSAQGAQGRDVGHQVLLGLVPARERMQREVMGTLQQVRQLGEQGPPNRTRFAHETLAQRCIGTPALRNIHPLVVTTMAPLASPSMCHSHRVRHIATISVQCPDQTRTSLSQSC